MYLPCLMLIVYQYIIHFTYINDNKKKDKFKHLNIFDK